MSLFTGMSQDQLQAALTSAQQALIALQSGQRNVSLSYTQGDGSKSVSKQVMSVGECTRLIVQLQQALGLRCRRRARKLIYL